MILITGADGQLGQALARTCATRGLCFEALSRRELDICDRKAVERLVKRNAFEAVINAAAYTAVDAAESRPGEAYAVNAYGPWLLAQTGVPILHVSTDYVFDGKAHTPYETDAPARPLSMYGLSKRAGETALLEGGFSGAIVRTAWVYDKRPGNKNFYQSIARLARERSELRVVSDQMGAPTLTDDLAQGLLELLAKGAHRRPMHLVHFTNAGVCSRFDFARAIVEHLGLNCSVLPCATNEFPAPAARPAYSALSLESLAPYGITPRHWLDALKE